MNRGYPPNMSASRPAIKKKAPATNEKELAGHVAASVGIARLEASVGMMTLNPEI